MPEPPMTICACCRDKKDGVWRFVCRCGFQAEVWRETPGCPRCGCFWEFEKVEVKAA